MKKVIVLFLILCMVFLLTGCSQDAEKRVTSAKIRYFDGTSDTVLVDSYSIGSGGVIHIHTDLGRTIAIGQNNVIIIQESEEQYNCQD